MTSTRNLPSGERILPRRISSSVKRAIRISRCVAIAKWLLRDCDILIFDEPTRGIDIGAKSEIYNLINELIAQGKSIIMISSEMQELLSMSDRIIVMCEGSITGELDIADATQESIMALAVRRAV